MAPFSCNKGCLSPQHHQEGRLQGAIAQILANRKVPPVSNLIQSHPESVSYLKVTSKPLILTHVLI